MYGVLHTLALFSYNKSSDRIAFGPIILPITSRQLECNAVSFAVHSLSSSLRAGAKHMSIDMKLVFICFSWTETI